MRGLRTRGDIEDTEFCRFFGVVQDAASEEGKVFFLDTSEGNEGEVDGFSCEELTGWLVPASDADVFEEAWLRFEDMDAEFFDSSVGVKWADKGGILGISFVPINFRYDLD